MVVIVESFMPRPSRRRALRRTRMWADPSRGRPQETSSAPSGRPAWDWITPRPPGATLFGLTSGRARGYAARHGRLQRHADEACLAFALHLEERGAPGADPIERLLELGDVEHGLVVDLDDDVAGLEVFLRAAQAHDLHAAGRLVLDVEAEHAALIGGRRRLMLLRGLALLVLELVELRGERER